LLARDPLALTPLRQVALVAASAVDRGDARAFVRAAGDYGRALHALGRAADAPVVPPAFAELAALAETDGAAFLPSGAGGGDVGIWLDLAPPSAAFVARAAALGMRALSLNVDRGGVRPETPPS
jgi:phosphomevalonate kinase